MSLPKPYELVQAGARAVAWLTALAATVVLAFVGNCWAGSGQAIIAGLVGSAIAMLNDSWEVAAIMDTSESGFPRLTTGRRVLHDLFSLAICIGGVIMMWVSSVSFGDPEIKTDDDRRKDTFVLAGLWVVLAVVAWRFIFALWGCADVSREASRHSRRRRQRRERRHRWPQ